jgi:hypothetical protein
MTASPFEFPAQGLAIPPAPLNLQMLQPPAAPRIEARQREGTGQRLLLAHGARPVGVSVCVPTEDDEAFWGRPCGRPQAIDQDRQGFWGTRSTWAMSIGTTVTMKLRPSR